MGESRACSVKSQNSSPNDNAGAQEFGNGHTLDQPVDGVFNNQDGDVNTRREPWKQLCVSDIEVLAKAHD